MADVNAYADHVTRAVSVPRSATAAAPLPRTVGITIALGISVAMWAVLIEVGIRVWSILPRP